MIIYLHGFRSGPESGKCQLLAARMAQRGMAERFWGEQLAWSPREAIEQVSCVIEASPVAPTLVGSSLGGFYATHLAERFGLRAVLVNPSVISHITLEPYIGPQKRLYRDETLMLTHAHLEEIRQLEVSAPTDLQRYWLLVEEGDEVLDYRQAVQRYQGARQTVLAGGDHGFTRWAEYLDAVIDFADMT